MLSRLCFEIDAPVAIEQIEIREVATNTITQYVIVRGQTRGFASFPEVRVAGPFLRAAFSIYREGLNTTNPYYGLLCFYRVAAGCQQYIGHVNLVRKSRGLAPLRESLIFEDLDGVGADFTDWIGKSCDQVAQILYKEYRVPAAHGLRIDELLLAADQIDQESKFWRAVPAARQIARKLLSRAYRARGTLEDGPISELHE